MTRKAALLLGLMLAVAAPMPGRAKPAPPHRVAPAQPHARNVILFIGDGMGLTSLDAASIYAYQKPQALAFFRMPHMALLDTTSTSHWVTDAGAASTAMATGYKTANRMVAAFPAGSGPADIKTIADYAEAHGLSTGGLTDDRITNPLISVFYAREPDRSKLDKVFLQLLVPQSGDGMDLIAGPGRKDILGMAGLTDTDLQTRFKAAGYELGDNLSPLSRPGAHHNVMLLSDRNFDLGAAVDGMIARLSENPLGYFLVVHSDCHLKDVRRSLDCVVALDRIVERVTRAHQRDTLVLVTADHAYGLRVEGQQVAKAPDFLAQVKLLDDHTGEDVPVLAAGPGSAQVRGFTANTDVFGWIMAAFGWRH